MRVQICAVGRLRSGPERDLIDDYILRFDKTGRALGLGPAVEHEVEDKKGGGMDPPPSLACGGPPSFRAANGAMTRSGGRP